MTNAEAVDLCQVLGVPVKSHSSSLNEAYSDMVRELVANYYLDVTRYATSAFLRMTQRLVFAGGRSSLVRMSPFGPMT